jgi:hypothetical protein
VSAGHDRTGHDHCWNVFGLVSGLRLQVKNDAPAGFDLRHLPPEPPVRRRLPPLPATTVSRTTPTVAHNHPGFGRLHVTPHVTAWPCLRPESRRRASWEASPERDRERYCTASSDGCFRSPARASNQPARMPAGVAKLTPQAVAATGVSYSDLVVAPTAGVCAGDLVVDHVRRGLTHDLTDRRIPLA